MATPPSVTLRGRGDFRSRSSRRAAAWSCFKPVVAGTCNWNQPAKSTAVSGRRVRFWLRGCYCGLGSSAPGGLVSLFLSPVLWLNLFLLLKTAPTLALFFLALAVAMQSAISFSPPVPWVPPFPTLIRMNLRQMLSVLDPYLALIIAIAGSIYRFATPKPDPGAFPILAILVALALSTYAQCLFSMDSPTRYSLLPLPGWRILLSKDAAFLLMLFILVLPLSPQAGLTFGLTSLAIGHWPSVSSRLALKRWHFTGGRIKSTCAAGSSVG